MDDVAAFALLIGSELTPEEAGCCDFNEDGVLWIEDLEFMQAKYCGHPVPENGDVNEDGSIDPLDVDLITGNFGPCPSL